MFRLALLVAIIIIGYIIVRYIGGMQANAAQNVGSSQHSTVETSLLKMILEHDSGNLDGQLLATDNQGKYLSELSLSELTSLYSLAEKQYPDSIEILAAYLDRNHGDDWREADNVGSHSDSGKSQQNSRTSDNGEMAASEAYAVLGLDQNATEEEIIAAHHKLMLKLHPDRGGSNYLAAKINQAKDLLVSCKGN